MAQFQGSNNSLKSQYWDKFLGDSMYSQSVANAMLSKSTNTSVSIASKALQDALNKLFGAGLQVDGIVGTKTLTTLNTYTAMINPNSSQNEQNIITHISVYNAPLTPSTSTTSKPATSTTNSTITSTSPTTPTPALPANPPTKTSTNWGKIFLYTVLAAGAGLLVYTLGKKKSTHTGLGSIAKKKKSTHRKKLKR